MTLSLKHKFQSAIPDAGDPTIVQPSNWNDEHALTQASGTILGRVSPGPGVTEELPPAQARTLLNVADGATANSPDAFLLARANHMGTESADVLTDGTTNKAFLATERTKLTGIATGATANSTDAQLRDRSTHTGTQIAATISDFSTAADARVDAGPSRKPRIQDYVNSMFLGGTVGIDCFGTSIMHGHDSTNPVSPFLVATPAPAQLQAVLRGFFGNTNITVVNRGVDGSNSSTMLAGTDGSGSTFAAKIAATSSQIIQVEHCLNDCQSSIAVATYRSNLLQIIDICRSNGKIPVLQTATPILVGPTGGSATTAKSIRLKQYVEVMKEVAAACNVECIDIYNAINALVRTGSYRVQDIVSDSVHLTQFGYLVMGNQMSMPYLHPHVGLSTANQFVSASEGVFNLNPNTADPVEATMSRTGVQWVSSTANASKVLWGVIRIDEPGMDIYVGYPIWANGLSAVTVTWDLATVGTINQNSSIAWGASEVVQDHEVCVARNVPVGMHFVTLFSASGAAALGLNYVRARPSGVTKQYGKMFTKPTITGYDKYRTINPASMTLFSSGTDTAVLNDEWYNSRLLSADGNLDIQFNATMQKDTAFIVHGILTAPLTGGTNADARMGVGVGCNTSGFVTVYEITGNGTYTATVLNAVDFSLVSRLWRIVIPPGLSQTLSVFCDGSLVGSRALGVPYLGGFMGIRSNGAGKSLTISNLQAVEHA